MTSARTSPRAWMTWVLLVLALAACGPRSMKQRLAHGEKRTDEASGLLNDAERELRALEAERAQDKLEDAKELLAHPDVELSPEGEMLRGQLTELTARVPQVREERARRDLAAAVEQQRDRVVQAMEAVTAALVGLHEKDAGAEQVEAVLDAVKRARQQQEEGKALEAKSEDYAASSRSVTRRLEQAEATAQLARRLFDFLSGPFAASREALELEKKAKRERAPETRLTLFKDAQERLRRCAEAAGKLLVDHPDLAQRPVEVEGRPTPLRTVASGCDKRADALERTVAKLEKAQAARQKALARKRK